jgi:hypothetical protein
VTHAHFPFGHLGKDQKTVNGRTACRLASRSIVSSPLQHQLCRPRLITTRYQCIFSDSCQKEEFTGGNARSSELPPANYTRMVLEMKRREIQRRGYIGKRRRRKLCYNSPTNTFKKRAFPNTLMKKTPESLMPIPKSKRKKKCTFANKQEERGRLRR